MLWVILPFKVIHAVFKIGGFETHTLCIIAFVSIGTILDTQCELGLFTSRHGGSYANIISHLNGFTCIDRSRCQNRVVDDDILWLV